MALKPWAFKSDMGGDKTSCFYESQEGEPVRIYLWR